MQPAQAVLGLAIAFGLGLVTAFLAGRIGFFSIIISFIAGGFIAAAVTRVIGWKRGTTILLVVLGGIIAGHVAGFGVDYLVTWSSLAGIPIEEGGLPPSFFLTGLMWAAISAGASCVGAYTRLR